MQGCSTTGGPSSGGRASAGLWGGWVKSVREGSEQETLAPDWTRETWCRHTGPTLCSLLAGSGWHVTSCQMTAGSHYTCSCSLSHASVSVHTHIHTQTHIHTYTHKRAQQIHLTMTHVSCSKGVWPNQVQNLLYNWLIFNLKSAVHSTLAPPPLNGKVSSLHCSLVVSLLTNHANFVVIVV